MGLVEAANAERAAKDAADKAAEEKSRDEDEDRKAAIAELEKKRKEKAEAREKAEAAQKERKKKLEEEESKKDPWLADPEVVEAKRTLEELKEERREANAKLEFDVTKQLTKDINTQERKVKSAIKKANNAFKKT